MGIEKKELLIRQASMEDLGALAAIEAICFPAAEAATEESLKKRLEKFGTHFLVMEYRGELIGFINGMVTDEAAISDVMFEDARLHKSEGKWQSVFGLDVLPDYQRNGLAAMLMEALIEQARTEKRKGCILTCKDKLIHYYEKFGYKNQGISGSEHGGAVWYDMVLEC